MSQNEKQAEEVRAAFVVDITTHHTRVITGMNTFIPPQEAEIPQLQKLFASQQSEIDRLTKERDEWKRLYSHQHGVSESLADATAETLPKVILDRNALEVKTQGYMQNEREKKLAFEREDAMRIELNELRLKYKNLREYADKMEDELLP